ncbi:hypothetical protein, partial [Nocardia cyriacigeorgica]|uniref:hypothetical protein n=1 Tax=Nocardia cyriacigeorgica TaxID=135487 RepID=UPI00140098D3
LAPYMPELLVDITAWTSTAAEAVLGVALLLGVAMRWTAAAEMIDAEYVRAFRRQRQQRRGGGRAEHRGVQR